MTTSYIKYGKQYVYNFRTNYFFNKNLKTLVQKISFHIPILLKSDDFNNTSI